MFEALINTKSNYRNLNGQWLEIKQFLGCLVACCFTDETGTKITVDFQLSEIAKIKERLK